MLRHLLAAALSGAAHAAVPEYDRIYYEVGASYPVFDGLDCNGFQYVQGSGCGCSSKLTGAHVVIDDGKCRAGDVLVPPTNTDLTSTWDASHCTLTLGGVGTLQKFVDAIAQVEFTTTATGLEERTVVYSLGEGLFDSESGHLFARYPIEAAAKYARAGATNSLEGESWDAAQYFCAHPDQDVMGQVGYLATIVSAEEQGWVHDHIEGQGWLGGSDIGTENEFRWITGPEGCPGYDSSVTADPRLRSACDVGDLFNQGEIPACTGTQCNQGTPFWTGTGMSGAAVNGAFTHWDVLEPNNGRGGEGYVHFLETGYWNDYKRFFRQIDGFLCEWGGVGEVCLKEGMSQQTVFFHALDECTEACGTCEDDLCDPDQDCEDPAPRNGATLKNWKCMCRNTDDFAVFARARCYFDECTKGDGAACHGLAPPQTCVDTDQEELGNFVCTCDGEYDGTKKGGVATCTLDECVHGEGVEKCKDKGQACMDDDQNNLGTFNCSCTGQAQGWKVGDTATCVLDECKHGSGVIDCVDENQDCKDPDTSVDSTGDYICTCTEPNTYGNATGKTAECKVNECDLHGDTCTDAAPPQECRDEDHAEEGDWECHCVQPGCTGSKVAAKAKCKCDECCSECPLREACENAQQECAEESLKVDGDAYCQCPAPAGSLFNVSAPVDDCSWDECTDNAQVCEKVGQECVDEDKTKKDSWVCKCKAPQHPEPAGSVGEQKPHEDCHFPPGDCEEYGKVCTEAGQECDPLGDLHDGTYQCKCPPKAEGDPQENNRDNNAKPATCELDECEMMCATCSKNRQYPNGTCGDGQTCVEGIKDLLNEHDWKCVCNDPYKGEEATARVAHCEIDECGDKCVAAHCAGATCDDKGQVCKEGSKTVREDWECHCPAGDLYEVAKAVEACLVDECEANKDVCESVNQTCRDVDQRPAAEGLNNWVCECEWPSKTTNKTNAAVCEVNECNINAKANKKLCAAAQQTCVDTDRTTDGSWECQCVLPAEGVGKQELAECKLDECEGNNACGAQECMDKDTNALVTGDWICICPDAKSVFAEGKPVPVCPERDECRDLSSAAHSMTHIPRYEAASGCLCKSGWQQACSPNDPNCVPETCTAGCCNPDNDTRGDWCFLANDPYNLNRDGCYPTDGVAFDQAHLWGYCLPAGTTPADGGLPLPWKRAPIDGVDDNVNNVCTDVGQRCVDPEPGTDEDWYCECVDPLRGVPLHGPQNITTCILDECDEHRATCAKANQRCEDLDTGVNATGSWVCICTVGPEFSAPMAPATCALDECVNSCETCAVRDNTTGDTVCDGEGQTCVDPNNATDATGDWRCECVAPEEGWQKAGVASCRLDECTALCETCEQQTENGAETCSDNNQTCSDFHQGIDELEDWECLCPSPSKSSAVANFVPACEVDECKSETRDCAAHGMRCFDLDWETPDTWYCECYSPYHGSQLMGLANCTYNECANHSATCHHAGQQCVDRNETADDTWYCECIMPDENGTAGHLTTGTCEAHGECLGNTVCSDAEQHCHDEAGADNWVCQCIDGSGEDGDKQPANCTIDECNEFCPTCERTSAGEEKVCALHEQECEDVDKRASSDGLKNWVCKCKPPSVGSPKKRRPAKCLIDECNTTLCTASHCAGTACSDEGQICEDKNQKRINNWVCKCPEPSTMKRTTAAVAQCLHNECDDADVKKVCMVAEQECKDPDLTKEGTWECHCYPPVGGHNTTGPAEGCDEYNECLTVCPTCAANDTSGTVCSKAEPEQTCVDPEPLSLHENWLCVCAYPSSGTAEKAAVPLEDCALDECVVQCETCADTGNSHTVCDAHGQECVEGGKHMGAREDWMCQCAKPLGFMSAPLGPVDSCDFDECEDLLPNATTPAGSVCREASQTCHDTQAGLGDFVCTCASGHGEMTGEPAECLVNECDVNGAKCEAEVFMGKPQTCMDPNWSKDGDWFCMCPLPATETRVGGPATCAYNECTTESIRAKCVAQGKLCVDQDPATADSWVCEGDDNMDECTVHRIVCTVAEQSCEDNYPGLGNWECVCALPAPQGAAWRNETAPVASCDWDECRVPTDVCPTCAGDTCGTDQDCEDKDMGLPATWYCTCRDGDGDASAPLGRASCGGVRSETSSSDDDDAAAAILIADDGCTFWGCYWWILLLLLLCCCCIILLLLLFLRRRQTETEEEQTKWNTKFESGYEGVAEELVDHEDDGEVERLPFKKSPKAMSGPSSPPESCHSLLYGHESGYTMAETPRPKSPKSPKLETPRAKVGA